MTDNYKLSTINSQLSLAPWRSLLAGSLHRNRSLVYARYLQLATVRASGRPANRTVVFRGFVENTNQLKFITDLRSQKVQEIDLYPWGEICWYFPKTREQFRIAGRLNLVNAGDSDPALQQARQIAWQEISEAARSQFAWPQPGENKAAASVFQQPAPDSIAPLDNFCLLLLEPEQVDFLELRGQPQNRSLYLRDGQGNWSVRSVNP
ncbi:MAG: pyridoxamine 5'-phosphate oxidase [Richelia sp. CSU_2_1]|nr:pyridoxamine 5'-phosphate oxidase [Richelia sp. CSU_2_1]